MLTGSKFSNIYMTFSLSKKKNTLVIIHILKNGIKEIKT